MKKLAFLLEIELYLAVVYLSLGLWAYSQITGSLLAPVHYHAIIIGNFAATLWFLYVLSFNLPEFARKRASRYVYPIFAISAIALSLNFGVPSLLGSYILVVLLVLGYLQAIKERLMLKGKLSVLLGLGILLSTIGWPLYFIPPHFVGCCETIGAFTRKGSFILTFASMIFLIVDYLLLNREVGADEGLKD